MQANLIRKAFADADQKFASEHGSADPYEFVLADLRAKRDQIDAAITAIEALRGGSALTAPSPAASNGAPDGVLDGSAFLGMTIPEAAVKALKIKRRKLPNVEMVAILKAGGLEMNSKDPINTVGSVLTRRADTVGDIVKVGRGVWVLRSGIRTGRSRPTSSFELKSRPKWGPSTLRLIWTMLVPRPARPSSLLSKSLTILSAQALSPRLTAFETASPAPLHGGRVLGLRV